MNDSMLAEQLRTLVDGVEPVAVAEVAERGAPAHAQWPRRRIVAAIAATVFLAAVALGAVLLARTGGDGPRVAVAPGDDVASTASQPLPESCNVTLAAQEGCALSPGPAATALGFQVRRPVGIPDGWVIWRQNLRLFTDETAEELRPPGSGSAAEYVETWSGPGVDMNQPVGPCAPQIVIFQSHANPFVAVAPHADVLDLGDGRTALGSLGTARCAPEPDARTADTTFLSWNDRGVWITLSAAGLDHGTVLAIARSLDR